MPTPPTDRSRIRRIPKRAHYDAETVFAILDAAFVGHVSFTVEGQPFILPMLYGRRDDTLYLHASTKSRFYRQLSEGLPVCMAVTHLDGLVLARSAFHHSVNYRSVVVFGRCRAVADGAEKQLAFEQFTEHILRGRWAECRWPNDKEAEVTGILALAIEDASAKIRTGGPIDDEADYALPYWAGVVPIVPHLGPPQPDERLPAGCPLPASVSAAIGASDAKTPLP